jgi:hypothetical protein
VGSSRFPIVRRRRNPSRALRVAYGDGLRPLPTEPDRKTPPRQEDMEAVIRAALASEALPSSIKRSEAHRIRGAVTGNIVDILKLDERAIDQLIIRAERSAESRGFRPPRVTEALTAGPGEQDRRAIVCH